MKNSITLVACALFCAHAALAQSGNQLFQQALMKERVEGNLSEAIALYERVVEVQSTDRELAAKALVQIGKGYERMGQTTAAQQIFRQVVSEYADQTASAAQARARLANVTEIAEVPGMVVRHLWTGPLTALAAASPDGRYFSYDDWATGELVLHDLEEDESRHLTDKGDWSDSNEYSEISAWSPDGHQIVYSWFNESFYELRIVDLDGGEPRILYRNPETDYLWPADWSQDGRHILALLVNPDKTSRIAMIEVETGHAQTIKSLEWRTPTKMGLSPDGRFIVYDAPVERGEDRHDIFVLAADGSSERTLVGHRAKDYGPLWMPDGSYILFVSDRTGTEDLWALKMEEGRTVESPRLIKKNVGPVRPIGITEDGRYHYTIANDLHDVHIVPVDLDAGEFGTPTRASDRFVGSNVEPAWSPDGEQLAFHSRRSDGTYLIIKDIDGGEEREFKLPLTLHPGMGPNWALDGRYLYSISSNKRDQRGIHRIDPVTGTAEFVTPIEGSGPEVWPAADGRLVYRHYVNDRAGLTVYDPNTDQETLLYRSSHILRAAVSPDGQSVAFLTAEEEGGYPEKSKPNVLKIIPVTGGDAREVARFDDEGLILFLSWTPRGQTLVYLEEHGTGTSNVDLKWWRIGISGGSPTEIPLEFPESLEITHLPLLDLHPSGDRLAATFGSSSTEFWMIEDFLPDDEGTD